MAKNDKPIKTETLPATVEITPPAPPVLVKTETAPDSRKRLTDEERKSVHEIGVRFRRLGYTKSDAGNACQAINRAVSSKLSGTGNLLMHNVRAAYGAPNGVLTINGSAESATGAFNGLSEDGMGAHFVSACEATLNGERLPTKFAAREPGSRKGTL